MSLTSQNNSCRSIQRVSLSTRMRRYTLLITDVHGYIQYTFPAYMILTQINIANNNMYEYDIHVVISTAGVYNFNTVGLLAFKDNSPVCTDKLFLYCINMRMKYTSWYYYSTILLGLTVHTIRIRVLNIHCIFFGCAGTVSYTLRERCSTHNQCFYKIQFCIYSLIQNTFP